MMTRYTSRSKTARRNTIKKDLFEAGVAWPGTDDEFDRLIDEAVNIMPPGPIRDSYENYYIDHGVVKQDGVMEDVAIYHRTLQARMIIVATITAAIDQMEFIDRIRRVYGQRV